MTKMETFPTDAETDVQATLGRALAKLTTRDASLLSTEANERTIACRLAFYLQAELPHWDVDCEYNCWAATGQRKGHTIVTTTSETTNARTIYPDILIHHRDSREHLAIIELCKSSFPHGKHQDVKKLRHCLAKLGCRHAFHLEVGVGEAVGENRIEPLH
ncbi:hypothetical protein QLQ86_18665 [Halomonas sp. LR5S13]|uniref:hypothetical protein n=1 Tax=Halomonas rhizosphaerae TaxID=3043296 RepID=UPI0024A9B563|nr:hypothetical protein [Halomonas rhizosphaerae]MDI5922791.1 hypothetical protein [Halomonas rhizosphaerae]